MGWKAWLWGGFGTLSVLLFVLGRVLPARPPRRDWVWSTWVLLLFVSLEAQVLVEAVHDVRGCLGRGQRGQALAAGLAGLGAGAFAGLLCAVLLLVDL